MRAQGFDPSFAPPADSAIIVGRRDLRALRAVVERHGDGPASAVAARLGAGLRRAIVVPQAQVPPEVVGIGSRVAFVELDTNLRRELVLALPDDAGIRSDRLSVLSPLAVALIGAAAGETVSYAAPGGKTVELRILSVAPGEEDGS